MIRQEILKCIVVGFTSSLLACSGGSRTSNELAEELRAEMTGRRFQNIYSEASEDISKKCTEQRFAEQLNQIVDIWQKINPTPEWSKSFDLVEPEGQKRLSQSDLFFAYREIGGGSEKLKLHLYWTNEYGRVQLYAITAIELENNTRLATYEIPKDCATK